MKTFWISNIKFVYYQYRKNIVFWDQKNIQKKLFRKPKFLDIKKKYLHIVVRNTFKQAVVPINGQILVFFLIGYSLKNDMHIRFFN